MFGRIAHRYDLVNRLMTFGRDSAWRREAVSKLAVNPGDTVLDLGAGTGDLAFEVLRQQPAAFVVASDFTAEMVWVGKQRRHGEKVAWVIADAMHLPFAGGCADAVVSGYLMRNVPDVDQTLREQLRTLKLDGRMSSLDTTPPGKSLLRPFLEFYLRRVIPMIGRLVAGDADAYTYLPNSTEHFLSAEALADRIRRAGFLQVGLVRRMFGTMAIHWGRKREADSS